MCHLQFRLKSHCSPEAVQIKAPRPTIYPVTGEPRRRTMRFLLGVSTREHEQFRGISIFSRKRNRSVYAGGARGVRHGRKSRTQLREISQKSEIWLEIRNQGLENPVEIRKSARNHEKWKKSREIRKSSRNHERILSEHAQYTFRACAFEKSTRKSVTRREINRLDLEITEIRKSRTPLGGASGKLSSSGALYQCENESAG